MPDMRYQMPNQAATGNGAVASWFHSAAHRRTVPALRRCVVVKTRFAIRVVFFLGATVSALNADAGADPLRVTVMSFNILEGGGGAAHVGFPASPRHSRIADTIHACGASVVGVQELGAPGALLKELGPEWHAVATGKSVYTCGIVSSLPMETLVVEDYLAVVRARLPAGGSLIVVNTHWNPPRNSGVSLIQKRMKDGTVPGDLAKFEAEIVARSDASNGPRGYRHTLDALRPHLASGENVILTGDFNESSHLDWTAKAAEHGMDRWVRNPTGRPLRFKMNWTGSRLLSEAGLRDAYRTVFPDEVANPGITWTPPYPDATRGRRPYADQILERIDMIYFNGRIEVASAGVVGEDKTHCEVFREGPALSDHRAVVATFLIKEPPDR